MTESQTCEWQTDVCWSRAEVEVDVHVSDGGGEIGRVLLCERHLRPYVLRVLAVKGLTVHTHPMERLMAIEAAR